MPHRIRMLMWGVAALVVATAVGAGVANEHLTQQREADAAALNLAGRQRMLSTLVTLEAERLQRDRSSATQALALRGAVAALTSERQWLASMPVFAMALAGARQGTPGLVSDFAPDIAPLTTLAAQVLDGPASVAVQAALQREHALFLPAMDATVLALQRHIEATNRRNGIVTDVGLAAAVLAICVALLMAANWFARRLAGQHLLLLRLTDDLQRLALVAERTDNAVVFTDTQGKTTWVNAGFERLTGHSLAEMAGRSPGEMLQFDQTDPATIERMRQHIQRREAVTVDVLNRSKAGREYWLRLDIQPVQDEQGEVTGFLAVQTDITGHVLAQQRLRAILESLPAGVLQQDTTGAIVYANAQAVRVLGAAVQAPAAAPVLAPDTAPDTDADMAANAGLHTGPDAAPDLVALTRIWRGVVTESGLYMPAEQQPTDRTLQTLQGLRDSLLGLRTPLHGLRCLQVNTEPLYGVAGRLEGVVSSFVDVSTARTQARTLSITVAAAGLATWVWNIATGQVEFGEGWKRLLGNRRLGSSQSFAALSRHIHPDDLPNIRTAMQQHLDRPDQAYRAEFRMKAVSGQWVWLLASGTAIEFSPAGRVCRVAGVHMDISARKATERALVDAAQTDSLTSLPNRRWLNERLAAWAAPTRAGDDPRFALLYLDVDRFKDVNDTLGHEAGDELLRQVASRLRQVVRQGDELARVQPGRQEALRLGGDEFVVLLDRLADAEQAEAVAQRLVEGLSAPYQILGRTLQASVSLGIVHCDRRQGSPELWLHEADLAMYEAKRRGGGSFVVFNNSLQEAATRRRRLAADLRAAIERPDGQLSLLYQPIVDIASGAIRSVEALARWQHPHLGPISPAEFIPIAEEGELIVALGAHVLEQACRDMGVWFARGDHMPATLSVNVSRAQLHDDRFAALVAATLERHGMAASRLVLEITESLADEGDALIRQLWALRKLGVSLALDDFGTGFSSLSALDRIPIGIVKIDRSFVRRMSANHYQTTLIDATVMIAKALGLRVVAEGVETEAEARALRQAGCECGQGWLFGRPAPLASFLPWSVGP